MFDQVKDCNSVQKPISKQNSFWDLWKLVEKHSSWNTCITAVEEFTRNRNTSVTDNITVWKKRDGESGECVNEGEGEGDGTCRRRGDKQDSSGECKVVAVMEKDRRGKNCFRCPNEDG